MKKIGIDLDGTVADYMKRAIPLMESVYGLKPNTLSQSNRVEEVFGFSSATKPSDMKQRLYVEHRLFRDLPQLEEENHLLTHYLRAEIEPLKIYFLTARDAHPVIMEDTRAWLTRNKFIYDDVFHTSQKAEFCQLAGISVMIEDDAKHAESLLQVDVDVVLMDDPWNRQILGEKKGRLRRVQNWREAFVAAKELLQ